MNVRKLKKLIKKFGGDPTGKDTVAELLDCLCMCDIGGGGSGGDAASSLVVVSFFLDEDECIDTEKSVIPTYESMVEAIQNGTPIFATYSRIPGGAGDRYFGLSFVSIHWGPDATATRSDDEYNGNLIIFDLGTESVTIQLWDDNAACVHWPDE